MRNDDWAIMVYNHSLECWLLNKGDRGYMMHCGDHFELYISKNQSVPCRLEVNRQWYLVLGLDGVRLYLDKRESYKIRI